MNERSAKVTNIPTLRIKPNPHNPRTLFDDEPMRFLEESIKKSAFLFLWMSTQRKKITTTPRRTLSCCWMAKDVGDVLRSGSFCSSVYCHCNSQS